MSPHSRVRHTILVNLTIMLFSVYPKTCTIMPKIMVVSDHYACVMLAEMMKFAHGSTVPPK